MALHETRGLKINCLPHRIRSRVELQCSMIAVLMRVMWSQSWLRFLCPPTPNWHILQIARSLCANPSVPFVEVLSLQLLMKNYPSPRLSSYYEHQEDSNILPGCLAKTIQKYLTRVCSITSWAHHTLLHDRHPQKRQSPLVFELYAVMRHRPHLGLSIYNEMEWMIEFWWRMTISSHAR